MENKKKEIEKEYFYVYHVAGRWHALLIHGPSDMWS